MALFTHTMPLATITCVHASVAHRKSLAEATQICDTPATVCTTICTFIITWCETSTMSAFATISAIRSFMATMNAYVFMRLGRITMMDKSCTHTHPGHDICALDAYRLDSIPLLSLCSRNGRLQRPQSNLPNVWRGCNLYKTNIQIEDCHKQYTQVYSLFECIWRAQNPTKYALGGSGTLVRPRNFHFCSVLGCYECHKSSENDLVAFCSERRCIRCPFLA